MSDTSHASTVSAGRTISPETLEWLEAELVDTLDEDYELELSEPALSLELRRIYKEKHPPSLERKDYFQALLTLQAELIKLQDWVQAKGEKIVVIFEGQRQKTRPPQLHPPLP